jgi:hypothetical protein
MGAPGLQPGRLWLVLVKVQSVDQLQLAALDAATIRRLLQAWW